MKLRHLLHFRERKICLNFILVLSARELFFGHKWVQFVMNLYVYAIVVNYFLSSNNRSKRKFPCVSGKTCAIKALIYFLRFASPNH